MKVPNWFLAVLLIGLLATALMVWPTLYRYDEFKLGNNVVPVKINRLTGDAQYLTPGGWRDVPGTRRNGPLTELPREALSALTGSAHWSYSSFKVELYNGSDWHVGEITVRIIVEGEQGWDRLYTEQSSRPIGPRSSGTFYISAFGLTDTTTFRWTIMGAKGQP